MLTGVWQYANIQVLNRLTRNRGCELQLTQGCFDCNFCYRNCAQLEDVFRVLQSGRRALAEPLRRLDRVNQNCGVKKQAHVTRAPRGNRPPLPPSSASTSSG